MASDGATAALREATPPGLRPAETAPKDMQFLAWGYDRNGYGFNQESAKPRWWLVHWGDEILSRPGSRRGYWRSSTPGLSSNIRIIGWLPLPWSDHVAAQGMANAQGVPYAPEQTY